ncbi:MAG: hypothetical protein ACYS76_16210 [Planctomycetota bacterium]|jgi:hypothetical protein
MNQALEAAIQKWELIIAGEIPYANGTTSCSLCAEYFSPMTRCDGCPLADGGYFCLADDSIHDRYTDAVHRGNIQLAHEIAHEMLTALPVNTN